MTKQGYSNANVYLPTSVKRYYDRKAEERNESLSAYLRKLLTRLKKTKDLSDKLEEV